jgi:hypothetical protein
MEREPRLAAAYRGILLRIRDAHVLGGALSTVGGSDFTKAL